MLGFHRLNWFANIDDLTWKSWGGEKYIVFNGAASETHYMDVFSLHVLKLLAETERSESELFTTLSADLGEELEETELREALSRTVGSLARSGLINRT